MANPWTIKVLWHHPRASTSLQFAGKSVFEDLQVIYDYMATNFPPEDYLLKAHYQGAWQELPPRSLLAHPELCEEHYSFELKQAPKILRAARLQRLELVATPMCRHVGVLHDMLVAPNPSTVCALLSSLEVKDFKSCVIRVAARRAGFEVLCNLHNLHADIQHKVALLVLQDLNEWPASVQQEVQQEVQQDEQVRQAVQQQQVRQAVQVLAKLGFLRDVRVVEAILSLDQACSDDNLMHELYVQKVGRHRGQVELVFDAKEASCDFDHKLWYWKLVLRGARHFPDEFGSRAVLYTKPRLLERMLKYPCYQNGKYKDLPRVVLELACRSEKTAQLYADKHDFPTIKGMAHQALTDLCRTEQRRQSLVFGELCAVLEAKLAPFPSCWNDPDFVRCTVLDYDVRAISFDPCASYELVDQAVSLAKPFHLEVLGVAKQFFDESPAGTRLAVKCLAVFGAVALDAWIPSMFESCKYFLICASLAAQELGRFSPAFLSDKPTVLEAISAAQSPWRHAHMVVHVWQLCCASLSQKDFVIQALQRTTRCGVLKYVVPSLRSDAQVVQAAFEANPTNIVWAPKSMQTKPRVIQCVAVQGDLLRDLPAWQSDFDVAMAAIQQNPKAYKHIHTTLKQDIELARLALSLCTTRERSKLLGYMYKRVVKLVYASVVVSEL